MKIAIGCGEKIPRGFIGCDIRKELGVEYVCNCWELDTLVSAGSVEEIYSRMMFEHVTFAQGRKTLRSWKKILKRGGTVRLIVPDLHYAVKEYLEWYDRRTVSGIRGRKRMIMPGFEHAVACLFGCQRGGSIDPARPYTSDDDLWDVHKSGYDEVSLQKVVEDCGFINFRRNPAAPWELDVNFEK